MNCDVNQQINGDLSTQHAVYSLSMTSIHTNTSAMGALGALRQINADLAAEQGKVSSGLRVETAADNAAYWSISTTMRSDNKALSAVTDALGLGAAIVDTTYSGLESVIDVLATFKSRLVAAKEDGVDKAKVQTELEQLKAQAHSIAQSATFAGQNWLDTDIDDITDPDQTKQSLVSGFTRGAADKVSVETMDFHISDVSLFNSTKGGLLQEDSRNMGTIGGIRRDRGDDEDGFPIWESAYTYRSSGYLSFSFSGPLAFDDPGDQIAFDITLDKDDPSYVPAPFNPGVTTSIVIDRSTVDAVDPSLNGIIVNNEQYARVVDYALQQAPAGAHAYGRHKTWDPAIQKYIDDPNGPDVVIDNHPSTTGFGIMTNESFGDGSYVEISNFNSTLGSGGLHNGSDFGETGSPLVLDFKPFEVYKDGDNPDGTTVSLNFSQDNSVAASYSFNRTDINALLGKTNGKVETAAEMVTLLQSLLVPADWPSLIIELTDPANPVSSDIRIKSDVNLDRLQGTKSSIRFSDITVSIEPLTLRSLDGIDIVQNPGMLDIYLRYVDRTMGKVIDGAAKLGALKSRLDMQTDFTQTMMQTIDKGVGRLVDNDMNASSARLKALQTQQQLGVQALSIANEAPQNILRLFQ